MIITYTGSPQYPQMSVTLGVGESYPKDKPSVTIIAFAADDAGDPCVCYVPYVQPPSEGLVLPSMSAKTIDAAAGQSPVTRLDPLAFLSQFCP